LSVLTLGVAFNATEARAAGWSSPVILSDTSLSDAQPTWVAVDGSGRGYVSVRQRFVSSSAAYGAREAVVSSTGTLLDTQPLSSGKQASAMAPFGPVAVDGAGDALFGWERRATSTSTNAAEVRQRSASGVLGPLILATDATVPDLELYAVGEASDASGLLVGPASESTGDLLARYISPTGVLGSAETVSTKVVVNSLGMFEFPNGDAMIAWAGTNGATDVELVQARYRFADGQWGPIRTLFSKPGPNSSPRLVVTGDQSGNGLVVWDGCDGSTMRVRARRISSAGAGPMTTLSGRGYEASSSGAALASDGAALVTWSQSGPSQTGDRCTGETRGQAKARWVFGNGTESATASLAPASAISSFRATAVLNGDAGSWIVFSYEKADLVTRVAVRSFERDGTRGTIERPPSPTGEGYAPVAAGGPNGELVVAFDDNSLNGESAVATVRSS
jgi:hypothetical protein